MTFNQREAKRKQANNKILFTENLLISSDASSATLVFVYGNCLNTLLSPLVYVVNSPSWNVLVRGKKVRLRYYGSQGASQGMKRIQFSLRTLTFIIILIAALMGLGWQEYNHREHMRIARHRLYWCRVALERTGTDFMQLELESKNPPASYVTVLAEDALMEEQSKNLREYERQLARYYLAKNYRIYSSTDTKEQE